VSRRLTARLARIEQAVTPTPDGPVCRFHGLHCQMGRNWPLHRSIADPAGWQMNDLVDLIREARRAAGLPVEPSPQELWAVNRHERVPDAELAAARAETARLIAEAEAENAVLEAQIRGERP
jgi:hypothetical protein